MDPFQERSLMAQAQAANQRGDPRGAMLLLNRVVEENPANAEARRGLALLMSMLGDAEAAVDHMRIALEARPDNALWNYDLGQLLDRAGLLEEALASMRRAEAAAPHEAKFPARIAVLLRRLRDDAGATLAAERALALDPEEPCALLTLSRTALKGGDLEEAEALARRVAEGGRGGSGSAGPMLRATGWHEVARVRERQQEYGAAFEAHMTANTIKLGTPLARDALQANIMESFLPYLGHGDARARYEAWGSARHDDGIQPPVILTGFIRSGTTMAEQVLAAHPGIGTCEELPLCVPVRRELAGMLGENASGRPFLEMLDGLTEEQVGRLRAMYRAGLEAGVPEAWRELLLVDKHPLRMLDMGLMNRLFPGARVIVMVRDPRDACLSAVFQNFSVTPFSVRCLTPTMCAAWYAQVMEFWRSLSELLTLEMLEVRYEDLVRDFDTWAGRMLEFAGVDWDESVREFHRPAAARAVRSPSAEAVTEQAHTRSIGRWRRYAPWFGDEALAMLAPFVESLGYEAE